MLCMFLHTPAMCVPVEMAVTTGAAMMSVAGFFLLVYSRLEDRHERVIEEMVARRELLRDVLVAPHSAAAQRYLRGQEDTDGDSEERDWT